MTHWTDGRQTLLCGQTQDVLATMPSESVDCVVTSPPYFGLRDYGAPGQLGLESTPAEYVEALAKTLSEVQRVLSKTGTLWLVIGDSYNNTAANQNTPNDYRDGTSDAKQRETERTVGRRRSLPAPDLPRKSMLGIPWRVAFALQDDGWILRNDIVWHKPNAIPNSVIDRLSSRYEHVFMFSRSRRYHFDLDAIREPIVTRARGHLFGGANKAKLAVPPGGAERRTGSFYQPDEERVKKGKNPGDVWSISTSPFKDAHFATYPPKLVERCLKAGCPAGGTVLDPFVGSGTTLMVAKRLGLSGVGIDLNPEYLDIAVQRIESNR